MTKTIKTKSEVEVTVIAEIATNITVIGKKNWDWKKAALAASTLLHITVGEYDCIINWQEVKEDDCSSDGSDWEINVKAEVITYVSGISADNWKQAADKALQVAQDNLEIISGLDVSIDWQPITEDMVN
ncbi:MAG: hypothetical protein ACKPA7_29460, partial [Sphaerospermopsis kisseleviana]